MSLASRVQGALGRRVSGFSDGLVVYGDALRIQKIKNFGLYDETAHRHIAELGASMANNSVLHGKSWVVVGDSITEKNFLRGDDVLGPPNQFRGIFCAGNRSLADAFTVHSVAHKVSMFIDFTRATA
jgi:hypothetical protein